MRFPDIYVNNVSNANGQGLVIVVISIGNENFQTDADTKYSDGHLCTRTQTLNLYNVLLLYISQANRT